MPGAFGCGKTVISQAENVASVSRALCDVAEDSIQMYTAKKYSIQCCLGKVLKGSEMENNGMWLVVLMPICQALSKYSNSDVVVYVSWCRIRFLRCTDCEWLVTIFQTYYHILYTYRHRVT